MKIKKTKQNREHAYSNLTVALNNYLYLILGSLYLKTVKPLVYQTSRKLLLKEQKSIV
jgi:hypothetical protein